MNSDPLEIAVWQLVTGDLRSEDLPTIAADALLRGVDSPTLGELAGQSSSDVRASRDLFDEVICELGIEVPDRDHALWNLIRETAHGLVKAQVVPEVGAHRIWRWSLDVDDSGDLRIFAGLSSELEDHPGLRPQLEARVRTEAGELLRRPRPRVWIKLQAAARDAPLSSDVRSDRVYLDSADVPIDEALRADLAEWNADHVAALSDGQRRGRFGSSADFQRSIDAGQELATRLQAQLGPDYQIEYWPGA